MLFFLLKNNFQRTCRGCLWSSLVTGQ